MNDSATVLWIDDEIDLLKPHMMFLEQKGYQVDAINNGSDALEMIAEKKYDIIFLDENMPGLNGLETLQRIKKINQNLPVVMITKSEEESIMEDAIGSQISDYLIKPVNPHQILLSLKKNLENRRLISEKTTHNYQMEFRQIGMDLMQVRSMETWMELFKKIVYWELELDDIQDDSFHEILATQKGEANKLWADFVEDEYQDWLNNGQDAPLMSHTAFGKKVAPLLKDGTQTVLLMIDNLRYDQYKIILPEIEQYFRVSEENLYVSILPTATQYARNSFFAGLLPLEIKKKYPELWVGEADDEGKNLHENELLKHQLKRLGLGGLKTHYEKVTQHQYGKKLSEQVPNLLQNDFTVIVYNFVDMLSHAKTDMQVIRELADNEKAYRSLTLSWFRNAPLFDIIRQLADKKVRVIITTDHGTINVTQPSKLVGERSLNTNLRYKIGRNMSYQRKEVFEVKDPEKVFLPKSSISDVAVFARENRFFAYPNNYNHYVKYYRDTFQHGGISLEEMIIPLSILNPR